MRPIHGSWSTLPGNWDPLHALDQLPSSDKWGIPDIPQVPLQELLIPDWMVACDDWMRLSRGNKLPQQGLGAVHFFTDDYRFESSWNNPHRAIKRWPGAQVLLSPDFSLFRDHPLIIQLWNTYRNRWCGAIFAGMGRTVIPTICWSDERSYPFAFNGVARGSVVAVSTVGTQGADKHAASLFLAGYRAMCAKLTPSLVVVHGEKIPAELESLAPIRKIAPWQLQLRQRAERKSKTDE